MQKETVNKGLLSAALLLVIASSLSGCGGGGGGPSATSDRLTPVSGVSADLSNQANATKVAGDAGQAPGTSAGLASTGNTFSGITGLEASGTGKQRNLSFSDVGQKLARIAFEQAGKSGAAITAASRTESCPNGGSLTVNSNLQNSYALNAGDTVTLLAKNCRLTEATGSVFLNGEMRLSVLTGRNISPYYFSGVILGFEMVPLTVSLAESDGSNFEASLDGGFQINFINTSSFQFSLMPGYTSLTQVSTISGARESTTLSDFDFTVTDALSLTIGMSGRATVDTTRISVVTGNATRYSWSTVSGASLRYNTLTEMITSGQMLLTSPANAARVRLTFGQSCSGTSSCVLFEQDPGTGSFTNTSTFTWSEYNQL